MHSGGARSLGGRARGSQPGGPSSQQCVAEVDQCAALTKVDPLLPLSLLLLLLPRLLLVLVMELLLLLARVVGVPALGRQRAYR